ncbi:VanZ family protein [Metabacillus mangrovi]|nr:VanZ family protein [Metabacillus mangrovi]
MVKRQVKTLAAGALILYAAFLLKLILFKQIPLMETPSHFAGLSRDMIQQNLAYSNWTPFATVKRYLMVAETRPGLMIPNLIGNFAGFIPFGILVPMLFKKCRSGWRMLLLSFTFSMLLECIQLSLVLGVFDVDDILLNTAGGAVGYVLYWLGKKTVKK